MVDDNKEFVEKCREVLNQYNRFCFTMPVDDDFVEVRMDLEMAMLDLENALKTTTGHDLNNHKPQGELK